jgi:NAD+ kinase
LAVETRLRRVALVVHPTRPIEGALETLRAWAEEHGLPVLQPPVVGWADRPIAREGELERGDLVVALGGDGTVLSALRASAPVEAPVLGAACGSVGALTAVSTDGLRDALDRVAAGDWFARTLPALAIRPAGAAAVWAINDFVIARRRAAQVIAEVTVDDELYVRLAGDGLIVATPLGSSAYTMAAGGPVLVSGMPAIVCTPLAMHGGSAAPLVVPAAATLRVTVEPGFGGFDIEIDGRAQDLDAREYALCVHDAKVTLISFGEPGLGLTALRERGLIADSPRVLARHRRALPSQRSVR